MERKIKNIFRILLALLSTLVLLGLGGLWRLASRPLRFEPHSPILRYVPSSIQFSEIFLSVGQFYTVPELEFRNVWFKTNEIEINAPRLFASWSLAHLLKGDFNISAIRFEQPDLYIFPSEKPEDPNSSLGSQLRDIFKGIPVKYLEMTQANLFFDYEHKKFHIENLDYYVLKLPRLTNFQASGRLKKGMPQRFEFSLKGSLENDSLSVKIHSNLKKIILADVPVSKDLQAYTRFYDRPMDVDILVNDAPSRKETSFEGACLLNAQTPSPISVHMKGIKKPAEFILNIGSPEVNIASLPNIWLPVAIDLRKWIIESVHEGILKDVDLKFHFAPARQNMELKNFSGRMEVKDGKVLYLKGLPVLEKIKGHLNFSRDKAEIDIDEGAIKDLEIKKAKVLLSDLRKPVFNLKTNLPFTSSFSTVVWYLNHPVLRKSLDVKIMAKGGKIGGSVGLAMPVKKDLKPQEIQLQVKSNLKRGDFVLNTENRNISFKDTNLSFEKDQQKLRIKGNGSIDGFKSDFMLEDYYAPDSLVKSQKKLKGSGDFKGLLSLFPSWLRGYLKSPQGGEAILDFTSVEDKDGFNKIEVDLDLTQSSLSVPVVNWDKRKGESAKIEVDLVTKDHRIHQFKKTSFNSKDLKFQGNVKLDDQGQISEIYFAPLVIKGAKATGKGALKNGIWNIVFHVPSINCAALLDAMKVGSSSGKRQERPSLNLDIKIGQLTFKFPYKYKNLSIFSKIRKGDVHFLELTGIEEDQKISILYKPQNENMVLDLQIPRLDTLLEGLEISEHVKSKKVQIQASKPLSNLDYPLKGKLFIEELKILNAPAFAKLLNLISIEGLIGALSKKGLIFNDNYAKFEYKDQKIALRRSRIMNSAIGITAKGYVDFKKKTLDLEGVLVPANFLNQLIGKVPLIGRFLTGGKDQGLFSVSYAAKGPFKDPEIISNPLGVVAPNIVKSLFGDLAGKKKPKPTLVETPAG